MSYTFFLSSCLPHKEFRFILPALTISMHYCGIFFQNLCTKPSPKSFKVPKSRKQTKSYSLSEEKEELETTDKIEGQISEVKKIEVEEKNNDSEQGANDDKKALRTDDVCDTTLPSSESDTLMSVDKQKLLDEEKKDDVKEYPPVVSLILFKYLNINF